MDDLRKQTLNARTTLNTRRSEITANNAELVRLQRLIEQETATLQTLRQEQVDIAQKRATMTSTSVQTQTPQTSTVSMQTDSTVASVSVQMQTTQTSNGSVQTETVHRANVQIQTDATVEPTPTIVERPLRSLPRPMQRSRPRTPETPTPARKSTRAPKVVEQVRISLLESCLPLTSFQRLLNLF